MKAIALPEGAVPSVLRLDVYARDRGFCRYCYTFLPKSSRFHIDHVHPRSHGGLTVEANLVLACGPCNMRKRDYRWLPLPIYTEPANIPEDAVQLVMERRAANKDAPNARSWGKGRGAHRQLARRLEQHIHRGDPGYGPGWVLPSIAQLAHSLGAGADTVQDAYQLLAHMGLVAARRGYGYTVRTPRDREVVHLPAGTTVDARMPTFAEQDDWGLEPGVPMLVADGRAWPADRFRLVVGDEAAPSGS